ncbi:MAG: MFS transporter [Cyclobacteriaceae bacterium]|nr:MFS transporter [Cyclobacteriaceae bacterium]
MIRTLNIFFSNTYFRTVGLIFAVNSILFGSWITRLPEVQNRLGIGEGELGIALLGLPLGSVLIMPFMGWVIHKLGDGKATLYSGVLFCVVSTFPVLAPGYGWLFLAMVMVGVATGSMDIAMNASAAEVEKRYSQFIMSACHGMWSVGGMIGAGSTSLLAWLRVDGRIHIPILGLLLLIGVIYLRKILLSIREETVSDVVFSIPTGPLFGLAVIGFCIMLGEGAIADWSAVYLKNTLKADAFYTGLGYAGFSFTMAVGRFYGDRIIESWGSRKLVLAGALIGMAGMVLGLVTPDPLFVVIGFTVAGLGFSCLIPAVYIAASRMPGRVPGASLAAVAGFGYFGLLIGPPVIGMIAEFLGLRAGLSVVVMLLLFVIILSGYVRFK